MVGSGDISIGRLALGLWASEQFARPRDVVGTGGLGEQAVVADAVSASVASGMIRFSPLKLGKHTPYQDFGPFLLSVLVRN